MKNLTALLLQLSELCNQCDTIRKQLISKLYTNRNRSVIAYSVSTGYNIDSKGKEIKNTTFIVPRFSVGTTSRRKDHSHDGVAHHRPLNTPFGKRINRRRNSVGGSLFLTLQGLRRGGQQKHHKGQYLPSEKAPQYGRYRYL